MEENSPVNVAIIPARGGSKGVPKKNVRDLGGKPTIAYTIEAAKNSGVVDRVFVSTDSEEIAEISKKYGAEVVWETEENTDQFNLGTESYLRYAVEEIKKLGIDIKDIVFLQATSPLTLPEDVAEAYKLYKDGYDSVLSVTKSHGGFLCGGFRWNENGESLNYDYKNRKRRAELPETYLENGAFYILSSEGLMKHQNRLYGKIGLYKMPKERSFEIDEPEDWEMIEYFMKRHLDKIKGSK